MFTPIWMVCMLVLSNLLSCILRLYYRNGVLYACLRGQGHESEGARVCLYEFDITFMSSPSDTSISCHIQQLLRNDIRRKWKSLLSIRLNWTRCNETTSRLSLMLCFYPLDRNNARCVLALCMYILHHAVSRSFRATGIPLHIDFTPHQPEKSYKIKHLFVL